MLIPTMPISYNQCSSLHREESAPSLSQNPNPQIPITFSISKANKPQKKWVNPLNSGGRASSSKRHGGGGGKGAAAAGGGNSNSWAAAAVARVRSNKATTANRSTNRSTMERYMLHIKNACDPVGMFIVYAFICGF